MMTLMLISADFLVGSLFSPSLFFRSLLENYIPKIKRVHVCNYKVYLNNLVS